MLPLSGRHAPHSTVAEFPTPCLGRHREPDGRWRTVLPFSGSRGPLAAFHVEQDLPAGTIAGGCKHGQRLGVLIDHEAVSDKPRRLKAASIEEPDDKRPGCGGIAEASANGDIVVHEVINVKICDLAMPGDT